MVAIAIMIIVRLAIPHHTRCCSTESSFLYYVSAQRSNSQEPRNARELPARTTHSVSLMSLLPHTECGLMALPFGALGAQRSLVLHSLTGEEATLDGRWRLCYDDEQWGFVVKDDDDADAIWVKNILKQFVMQADSGSLYVASSDDSGVKWLKDVRVSFTVAYAEVALGSGDVVRVKLYKTTGYFGGSRLFVQLRDVQDPMYSPVCM